MRCSPVGMVARGPSCLVPDMCELVAKVSEIIRADTQFQQSVPLISLSLPVPFPVWVTLVRPYWLTFACTDDQLSAAVN